MASRRVVASTLARMTTTFRFEDNSETLEAWCLALDDMTDEQVQRGLRESLRSHTSIYLTPAEFRRYARDAEPRLVL